MISENRRYSFLDGASEKRERVIAVRSICRRSRFSIIGNSVQTCGAVEC